VRGINLDRFDKAVAAIDAANNGDPTCVPTPDGDAPLAQLHGRLAFYWVQRLAPRADEAVLLAARAHHLRRWELDRHSYQDGRAGYLRWRRDQKQRHGRDVALILSAASYDAAFIERVQALIRRDELATDPDAQLVEDGACLAFMQTQLESLGARLEHDRLIDVLVRTLAKMSPPARRLVREVNLDDASQALIDEALNRG
jgi:Domain of unknown function (DUF4202)